MILVREGYSAADISKDFYPDLTSDDVLECCQYAVHSPQRGDRE
jgi:uncharacterized protein (DUF433 family)